MSAKQIRYTAKILLLLYIGYFSCVSYFVHTHVYNGVIYVHSHPYKKLAKNADDNNLPPFETHNHTSAGFFTFNQLSNLFSQEATECIIEKVYASAHIIPYKQQVLHQTIRVTVPSFNHRAPPSSQSII